MSDLLTVEQVTFFCSSKSIHCKQVLYDKATLINTVTSKCFSTPCTWVNVTSSMFGLRVKGEEKNTKEEKTLYLVDVLPHVNVLILFLHFVLTLMYT